MLYFINNENTESMQLRNVGHMNHHSVDGKALTAILLHVRRAKHPIHRCKKNNAQLLG